VTISRRLFTALAASAAFATPALAQDDTVRIALVVKALGIGFFEAAAEGAEEAAAELGNVEIIYTGPTDTTAEGQIEVINSLIAQGVDAIAVSANDPDALVPVLQRAMQRGITVISWDSGVAEEGPLAEEPVDVRADVVLQRLGQHQVQVVLLEPAFRPHLDHVAETLRGHERRLRSAAFDQRVGGERGAVDDLPDLPWRAPRLGADLVHAIDDGLLRRGMGRENLGGDLRACSLQHDVGERPADIHAQPCSAPGHLAHPLA